jgi:hypothetical protein
VIGKVAYWFAGDCDVVCVDEWADWLTVWYVGRDGRFLHAKRIQLRGASKDMRRAS